MIKVAVGFFSLNRDIYNKVKAVIWQRINVVLKIEIIITVDFFSLHWNFYKVKSVIWQSFKAVFKVELMR